MNLNDPFGRMEARHGKDYESLRDSLKKSGITQRAEAEKILDSLNKKCWLALAFAIPLAGILALLISEAQVIFLALGALFAAWVLNATRRGKEYLRRYIKEETGDS